MGSYEQGISLHFNKILLAPVPIVDYRRLGKKQGTSLEAPAGIWVGMVIFCVVFLFLEGRANRICYWVGYGFEKKGMGEDSGALS